ncbi:MAG: type II secretion system protein [Candidatus Parcubacteria bacterium]|nr:type II secretion system protein [Candidatus Parcubacteria bacterium]
MNNYTSQSKNGFTLIETILYLGLLSIIVVFLVYFLQQSIYIKGKINERLDNLDNAQYALDRMVWYAQNSLKVESPQIGQISDKLEIDSLVSAKNPIKFYVQDKTLKMQVADNEALNLTNERIEVLDLSFTNQGFINQPAIIQIKMTVKGKYSFWQTEPITLQTAVKVEK